MLVSVYRISCTGATGLPSPSAVSTNSRRGRWRQLLRALTLLWTSTSSILTDKSHVSLVTYQSLAGVFLFSFFFSCCFHSSLVYQLFVTCEMCQISNIWGDVIPLALLQLDCPALLSLSLILSLTHALTHSYTLLPISFQQRKSWIKKKRNGLYSSSK